MSVAYDRLDALREMLYIIDSDMPEEKKLYMLYHYYIKKVRLCKL